MIGVNLKGPYFLIQDTVKIMIEQNIQGSIINIGSVAAMTGQPFISTYCVSKGALATLTRNTAFALLKNKIRVNQLNIGWMASDGEHEIQTKYHNAPENWLEESESSLDLITTCDGPFKKALDRTKYPNRYPEEDPQENRMHASKFLNLLERELKPCLFGEKLNLADIAILPFVRQFAHIDFDWFLSQPWPKVAIWLESFKTSAMFSSVMKNTLNGKKMIPFHYSLSI